MNSKISLLKYLVVISLHIGMIFHMYGCCPQPSASIIPRPQNIDYQRGAFVVNARTTIVANEETKAAAEQLRAFLKPATGLPLKITTEPKEIRNAISLQRDEQWANLGQKGIPCR